MRNRWLTNEEIAASKAEREAREASLTDREREARVFDQKAEAWRTAASELAQNQEQIEFLGVSSSRECAAIERLEAMYEEIVATALELETEAHHKRLGFASQAHRLRTRSAPDSTKPASDHKGDRNAGT